MRTPSDASPPPSAAAAAASSAARPQAAEVGLGEGSREGGGGEGSGPTGAGPASLALLPAAAAPTAAAATAAAPPPRSRAGARTRASGFFGSRAVSGSRARSSLLVWPPPPPAPGLLRRPGRCARRRRRHCVKLRGTWGKRARARGRAQPECVAPPLPVLSPWGWGRGRGARRPSLRAPSGLAGPTSWCGAGQAGEAGRAGWPLAHSRRPVTCRPPWAPPGWPAAAAQAAGVGALSGLPLRGRCAPRIRPKLPRSCAVVSGCFAWGRGTGVRAELPAGTAFTPCRAPRRGGRGARRLLRFLGVAKPPNHSYLNKAVVRTDSTGDA